VEKLTDLFEQARAAAQAETGSPLTPIRYPNRDFFIADLLDWAVKDDRHSMEHPMFSLSKKPDREVRHYEHNGCSVTIKPGADGLPSIWDKDIVIYVISQLRAGLDDDRNDALNRKVRFTAYNYFVVTNRGTDGRSYERLEAGLSRLKGTTIKTNIAAGGVRIKDEFSLIDHVHIVERSPIDDRMAAIEITLSEWLYNAVLNREVLTLNRDYFRLDSGVARRLYELARKHCGRQDSWIIGLDLLHKKSGSRDLVKRFRAAIKRFTSPNGLELLEYLMSYDAEADRVVFARRE
jgi:plasmid replication initiation protein